MLLVAWHQSLSLHAFYICAVAIASLNIYNSIGLMGFLLCFSQLLSHPIILFRSEFQWIFCLLVFVFSFFLFFFTSFTLSLSFAWIEREQHVFCNTNTSYWTSWLCIVKVRYELKRLTEWANADIVCRSTYCTICLFIFNYPLIVIEK